MYAKEKSGAHIPTPESSALQMVRETLREIQGELDPLKKEMETQTQSRHTREILLHHNGWGVSGEC